MIGAAVAKPKKAKIGTIQANPTPERMRRAGQEHEVGGERGAVRVLTMRDAPLERALSRGAITSSQYTAGEKYRIHWHRSGLQGLPSSDLGRIFAGFQELNRSEKQIWHGQRYHEAKDHLGKIDAEMLDALICDETPLEQIGYWLGWHSRSSAIVAATERMKAALDGLRKLWGI